MPATSKLKCEGVAQNTCIGRKLSPLLHYSCYFHILLCIARFKLMLCKGIITYGSVMSSSSSEAIGQFPFLDKNVEVISVVKEIPTKLNMHHKD